MKCKPCGHEIPDGVKYFAVFPTPNGLRIEIGCAHYTPPDVDKAVATLGSQGCFLHWLHGWSEILHNCDHSRKPS